jgi:hypothetical protein
MKTIEKQVANICLQFNYSWLETTGDSWTTVGIPVTDYNSWTRVEQQLEYQLAEYYSWTRVEEKFSNSWLCVQQQMNSSHIQ